MTKDEAIICVRKIFGELTSDDYLNEWESEAFMMLLDSLDQTEAAIAAERERIIAELEDIQQGGDEWRRYDEALREAIKIVKGGDER